MKPGNDTVGCELAPQVRIHLQMREQNSSQTLIIMHCSRSFVWGGRGGPIQTKAGIYNYPLFLINPFTNPLNLSQIFTDKPQQLNTRFSI